LEHERNAASIISKYSKQRIASLKSAAFAAGFVGEKVSISIALTYVHLVEGIS